MSIQKNSFKKLSYGTSPLLNRISALNKLVESDYKVGIIIAPVILVDQWKQLYKNLFITLSSQLSSKAKTKVFFEVILMTYSYIHKAINEEAFPQAISLYDTTKMKNRGLGKYSYKEEYRQEAEEYLKSLFLKYFPQNKIVYFS